MQDIGEIEFQSQSPWGGSVLRPTATNNYCPWWRWEMAVEYAKMARIPQRISAYDSWLPRLIKFAKGRVEATGNKIRMYALRDAYPDLSEACDIWNERMFGRWAVEAMIVARMPYERISRIYPIRAPALRAFKACFFDMEGLLDLPAFVFGVYLAPVCSGKVSGNDSDQIWKFFAYVGGEKGLLTFWNVVQNLDAEHIDRLKQILQVRSLHNAVVSALTNPATKWNSVEMQRLYLEFEHAKAEQLLTGQSATDKTVANILEAINGIMGDRMVSEPTGQVGAMPEASLREEFVSRLIDYVQHGSAQERKVLDAP